MFCFLGSISLVVRRFGFTLVSFILRVRFFLARVMDGAFVVCFTYLVKRGLFFEEIKRREKV